ncbi:MAG: hypothetical protein OHK0038_01950 [Flammeovirgaceae bacterium]
MNFSKKINVQLGKWLNINAIELRYIKWIGSYFLLFKTGSALWTIVLWGLTLNSLSTKILPSVFLWAAIVMLGLGRFLAYLERKISYKWQIILLLYLILIAFVVGRVFLFLENLEVFVFSFSLVAIGLYRIQYQLEKLLAHLLQEKAFQEAVKQQRYNIHQSLLIYTSCLGYAFSLICLWLLPFDALLDASIVCIIFSVIVLQFSPYLRDFKDTQEDNKKKETKKSIFTNLLFPDPESFLLSFIGEWYILKVCAWGFVLTAVFFLIELAFVESVQHHFENAHDTSQFLGVFGLMTWAVVLVSNLLLHQKIVARLGLKRSSLLFPFLLLPIVILGWWLGHKHSQAVLWWSGGIFMVQIIFQTIFQETIFRNLFLPIKPEARLLGNTVLQGAVVPASWTATCLFLIFFTSPLESFSIYQFSKILLILLIIWIILSYSIERYFLNLLEKEIKLRTIESSDLSAMNKSVLDILRKGLSSSDADEVIYSAEMLSTVNPEDSEEWLIKLWMHPSENVKVHAFKIAARLRPSSLASYLTQLIYQQDSNSANPPQIFSEKEKVEAVKTLCFLTENWEKDVLPLVKSNDRNLRKGAIIGLAHLGIQTHSNEPLSFAEHAVSELVCSERTREKLLACEITAEVQLPNFAEALMILLEDHDNRVRKAAIQATSQSPDSRFAKTLVKFMKVGELGAESANALTKHGESALQAIEEEFAFSKHSPQSYMLTLCNVLGKIGFESGMNHWSENDSYQKQFVREKTQLLLWDLVDFPWIQMQEEAYKSLRYMKYVAESQKELYRINDQLEKIFSKQFWLYSAIALLEKKSHYHLLVDALQAEINRLKEAANTLVSFLQSPDKYKKESLEDEIEQENNLWIEDEAQDSWLWDVLPDTTVEKLLITSSFYTNQEKLEKLSDFYNTNLLDEVGIFKMLLKPKGKNFSLSADFSRWTQAVALYVLQDLSNPSLVKNALRYLQMDDLLLLETSLQALKKYGKNRGFSLKHILEETDIPPTRIQLLMGILNDTTKPLMEIEKVLILKSTRMFAETPEHLLADIAQIVKEERVSRGKSIFRKGDVGDRMYIVYEGEIRIHDNGITFNTLINGDFFGELGLLDSKPRSASATALRDSLLLRIDQEDFYELLATRKEVVKGIMRVLCERIRSQSQLISDLSFSTDEAKNKDKNALKGKIVL